MSQACPLNFIPVDSNSSRISALIVATLIITYVITLNEYILYFLIVDAVMKLFIKKDYSVIFISALSLRKLFKIQEKMTDGGAKRLAGIFGFTFVLLLLGAHFLNLFIASLLIAAIFITCLLLDVFLDYCFACKIYFIIKKIYPSFMN